MKPSERIQELANKFREENKRIDSWKIGIDAIVTYLDEQAELLETHTVKEEPTTPEKKCCEDWVTGAIIDEMTRVNPARHLLKGHQGEKRNDIY